jgi:hypothetical protein
MQCLYWLVLLLKVFLQLAREEQAAAQVAGLEDDGLYSCVDLASDLCLLYFGIKTGRVKLRTSRTAMRTFTASLTLW